MVWLGWLVSLWLGLAKHVDLILQSLRICFVVVYGNIVASSIPFRQKSRVLNVHIIFRHLETSIISEAFPTRRPAIVTGPVMIQVARSRQPSTNTFIGC
jgi:hypothetical protein